MLLSRSLRSPLLRATVTSRVQQPAAAIVHQRRFKHELPALTNYGDIFAQQGVPNLMSPDGFKLAWTQYQQMMLDAMSARTAGTTLANNQPQAVLLQAARLPQLASLFNYASMAYNNHMFFRTLAPQEVSIPTDLKDALLGSFSSIDTLRADFLATANAMFGPGFVWLVYQRQAIQNSGAGAFRILPTYLAGSPLSEAHWRQQPVDMNTQNASSVGGLSGADFVQNNNNNNNSTDAFGTAGGFGPHSAAGQAKGRRAPGGADVHPILCVNTWQHVWLTDYGIDGKADFLENWWDRINWNEVHALTPPDALKSRGTMSGAIYNSVGAR